MHRNRGGRIRALIVGAAVILLAACSSGGGNSKPAAQKLAPIPIKGEVTVNGSTNVRGSISRCAGAGPFVDLYQGATVVVANPHGKPLRVGAISLTAGTNSFMGYLDQCTFEFTVGKVPQAQWYWVYIARQVPKLIPSAWVAGGTATVQIQLNPPLRNTTG
ncbi:MAG: hypothetical protein ACXVKA_04435 [Acidimicrobiia bacterium]